MVTITGVETKDVRFPVSSSRETGIPGIWKGQQLTDEKW